MEKFSHSGFTPRQLKKLKRCQIYLQIHTLSDISNGHGTYFEKVTMMSTKINFVKTPTHGLIKDSQYQKSVNCGVSTSENDPQVIITQPIFTNSVNGQITAKKNWTWFYHQKLRSLFYKSATGKIWKKYK